MASANTVASVDETGSQGDAEQIDRNMEAKGSSEVLAILEQVRKLMNLCLVHIR